MNPFRSAIPVVESYLFNKKTLGELPPEAIQYLIDVAASYGLILPPITHTAIEQRNLIRNLSLQLSDIDNKIMDCRRSAVNVPPPRSQKDTLMPTLTPMHVWWREVFKLDDPHMLEIVRLLSQRTKILRDFIVRFDALVWNELQGSTLVASNMITEVRTKLLWTVLLAAQLSLRSVQEFVERGTKPSEEANWFTGAISALQTCRAKYCLPICADVQPWPTSVTLADSLHDNATKRRSNPSTRLATARRPSARLYVRTKG
ncbi:hypothetical protein IEO21_07295 [Rhodonia placenta]|uniref:Uncharacterized protein n=1 Tax=Rhodonia placenta TaxID=104341 RepID=A0A8H7NYF3_9APHY|nr:hypothetical protein IEO21_07295 [Postia placenta]